MKKIAQEDGLKIKKRLWRLNGHVLRIEDEVIVKKALHWTHDEKKERRTQNDRENNSREWGGGNETVPETIARLAKYRSKS